MNHHHQRHRQTEADLDAAFARMQADGQGLWQLSVCSIGRLAADVESLAAGAQLPEDVLLRVRVLVALWDAIRDAPADQRRACLSCDAVFSMDGQMPFAFGTAKAAGTGKGDVVALAICKACAVGGQDVVMERVIGALGRWSGHKLRYFAVMHPAGHA